MKEFFAAILYVVGGLLVVVGGGCTFIATLVRDPNAIGIFFPPFLIGVGMIVAAKAITKKPDESDPGFDRSD